jgi:hypothetical protein
VKNIGSGNAAELATYVAEEGKPLVVPAKRARGEVPEASASQVMPNGAPPGGQCFRQEVLGEIRAQDHQGRRSQPGRGKPRSSAEAVVDVEHP